MSSFGTQTRDSRLQNSVPYMMSAVCLILHGMPLGFGWLPELGLGLFLVPLFTIALASENELTPAAFVFLGLMADVLMETPLGYWAVLSGIFYILSSGQKQVLQNAGFGSHWVSFSLVVLIVYMAGYTISLLRDDLQILFSGHLLSAILTGVLYPIVAAPLLILHNAVYGTERG